MDRQPARVRLHFRSKLLLALGMGAVLGAGSIAPGYRAMLETLEHRVLDYGFILRGPQSPRGLPILLVFVDDVSLGPYGFRSPTPRALLAEIVQAAHAKDARCLGLDFVLDRPSLPGHDAALEAALAGTSLPIITLEPALPAFARHTTLSTSRIFVDARNVARHYGLSGHAGVPSFAEAILQRCAMAPPPAAPAEGRLALINYYGTPTRLADREPVFAVVAAADFASIPAAIVRDRVVLVGQAVEDLGDTFVTPYSTAASGFRQSFGLELHATMVGTMVEDRALWPLSDLHVGLLAGAGLFIIALSALALPFFWSAGVGLFVAAGWMVRAAWLFVETNRVAPVVGPLLLMAVAFVSCQLLLYFTERRYARFLRSTFSRYLAADVVDDMVERGVGLRLGGEGRRVTVLFSDLEGFTALSEQLAPPQVVEILNRYLSAMTEALLAENATIGDFIGDAIMAYFGAPREQHDHAVRACRAALTMSAMLERLNPQWESEGLPRLRMRIGIHTGDVVIGNIGSERRSDFTIIGDTVNLASRLEGANKAFGTRILVSQETLDAMDSGLSTRQLGRIVVQGRNRPVAVYELLDSRDGPTTEAHRRYGEALALFYNGEFRQAARMFERAAGEDSAAAFMAARSAALAERPLPEPWLGAVELTAK